jgi:hypothetical protein
MFSGMENCWRMPPTDSVVDAFAYYNTRKEKKNRWNNMKYRKSP